jgi:ferritin-like metal-binding protein YciE
LTDAHAIEQQALVQMKAAPAIAGDPHLASLYSEHRTETEAHGRLVRERLEARGATSAGLKDLAGTVTGVGFALFARLQPDTPGKLVTHAYSYEHMEQAAYELLSSIATRAGDNATAETARRIEVQERAMADRLANSFDLAVEASLRELKPDDLGEQLDKYLADAHAIEGQAFELLKKGPPLAAAGELAAAYDEHRVQTQEHSDLIETRLRARGDSPSRIKDAALRLGALNWGMFFQAQPDTPAKLAAFSYAFEHLEIAAYEMLKRIAARAGDSQTEAAAETILGDERAAAHRIHSLFEQALEGSLRAQDVAA